MKATIKYLLILSGLMFISACVPVEVTEVPEGAVVCQEPISNLCPLNYDPVCGTRDTGVRCVTSPCPEAIETKTYGNACAACNDEKILHHVRGACETESTE